jgi:hypothetical protein
MTSLDKISPTYDDLEKELKEIKKLIEKLFKIYQ